MAQTTSINLSLTKGSSRSKLGAAVDGVIAKLDATLGGINIVPFSATPAFDASKGYIQQITLTGNVTSSTITNPQYVGQVITFKIVEDATGARTFAFPASAKGATAITTTANRTNMQEFIWDGSNWLSLGAGQNF